LPSSASDEPKAALIARFNLSDRQAEDILEIRLRQLARLEAIKIEQELGAARGAGKLEDILGNPALAPDDQGDRGRRQTVRRPRRTLIQAEKRPWPRSRWWTSRSPWSSPRRAGCARNGHGHEATSFAFKAGDGLYGTFECRTVDLLLVLGSNGRVYSVPVSALPGARGDGQPVTTLIELEAGSQPAHYFAGPGAPPCCSAARAAMASWPRWATWSRATARQGLCHLGEGETCVHLRMWPTAAAARRGASHPCGLRLHGRAHPDLRDRRAQDARAAAA
jgi:topoisomerase-4 subunit A